MQDPDVEALLQSTYLSGNNADYLEEIYESFLKDPESVSPEWRDTFESFPKVNGVGEIDISHADIRAHFRHIVKEPIKAVPTMAVSGKQINVERLVQAYRRFGHLAAKLDPLGATRLEVLRLELDYHGLSDADVDTRFLAEILMNEPTSTLRDILAKLKETYCGTVTAEYMHIREQAEVDWIQKYFEHRDLEIQFSNDNKLEILRLLVNADSLEKYLGSKYAGQKRFSLEGGDSLIPMLHEMAQCAGRDGVKELVMGMAHRGRLNVLVNIVGQSPEELFQEFEGKKDYGMTTGDVKYHLGFSSDINTSGGPIHLSLSCNPSHLEIIAPVVIGSVRGRQHMRRDEKRDEVMAVIVHGDAAFAAQGIVMETFSMSQTRGQCVGGTVHIVVNNQLGFTTSNPHDARSSLYCTDIAKMLDIPIFHVNGDDPEACVFVSRLALDYRMKFHKDVVIDLVCYRRHGHQEADEPTATQPMMYQKISVHPTSKDIYTKQLIAENVCDQAKADEFVASYRDALDQGHKVVDTISGGLQYKRQANWTPYLIDQTEVVVDTGCDKDKLIQLAKALTTIPEGFTLQRQVGLMTQHRVKMAAGEIPLDWGFAETLAYATLLEEGFHVRLLGQDSRRGTFSHRHAVLHDYKTGEEYTPMSQIYSHDGDFQIYDSLLSEAGAMAFEYGYAKTDPQSLVIWEAQYGDFANNAQVVIDQFISSAWQKWMRLCGLVLFLPHGYEGMGPEHSSARLERYMQLCAQLNIQICVPSTPSQIFHLLRRQMLRPIRKPLIVMTPKSLLRNKLAVSSLETLAHDKFHILISEIDEIKDEIKPDNVRKVIACSGKIYYEILSRRREENKNDIAIIRIEQLYPFPKEELSEQLKYYGKAKQIIWCQEEPKNQGAWFSIRHWLEECLQEGQELEYVGKKVSAAPAAGYFALYKKLQEDLVERALG